MNTKHTRVVVTLFLAIATLATMGFSAAHEDNRATSITPDHITCASIEPSLTAIELLEFVDEPCLSGLIDKVETEIGWSLGSRLSTNALIDSILDRSRATGSGVSEYLELLESETDAFTGPSELSSAAPAESPVALSGPSATDVPLAGIYTNARTTSVRGRPQVEPSNRLGPRVGFSGPSATDVPLISVYTNN